MKKDSAMMFDVRTLDRKLKNGEITQKEYDTYLESMEEINDYDEIDEDQLVKDAGIVEGEGEGEGEEEEEEEEEEETENSQKDDNESERA